MSTTAEWYVTREGAQEGPMTEADVVARIRSGRLDAQSYVWGPGLAEWTLVSGVPQFASHIVPPRTAAAPVRATPAPASSNPETMSAAPAPAAAPAPQRDVPSYSLQQVIPETGERDRPGDVFE